MALRQIVLGLLASLTLVSPVLAHEDEEVENIVVASDPATIMTAMSDLGLSPELTTDNVGDPLIISRESDGVVSVFFFGCDELMHNNCHTIRLQVGFDRAKPWNIEEASALMDEYPFVSVRLDDEGDPFLHWDLFLGEGIPEAVFTQNLGNFLSSAGQAAAVVYAEQLAEQEREPEE